MTRVLLADDHASFRQPLAFMLNHEPDMEVAGQAGTVVEACAMLGGVDVAVVDLDLPDGSGIEIIRALREVNPRGMVLVLSASTSRGELAEAVEAGAAGVLHKSAGVGEVVRAVRRLAAGESLLAPQDVIELLRQATRRREESREARAALAQLTPREREVLEALGEGLSDKEIAERLVVGLETVRTHMVNILAKLGVNSRLQALVFAIRHGAIEIG